MVFTRLRKAVIAIQDVPRVPARSPSPSLIVNVLFIDIVGYSKLSMEGQEEASCDLTEAVSHISAVSKARENGELTCLDTGDGMVLVFEGNPTTPAIVALELTYRRGAHPARAIRIGLHSGPATRVRDINGHPNYKGVGINVTQRVMDCAGAGQIFLTEHYASLLRSYEGWTPRIALRGTFSVKHGLKLRVCELKHDFSHKPHLSEKLLRPLRPLSAMTRWMCILALIALCSTNLWIIVMNPPGINVLFPNSGAGSRFPEH